MRVGKSFVGDKLRTHRYEVEELRRLWKARVPHPVPVNHAWGMDLTGKPDASGHCHAIAAIVDHGSRRVLCLSALKDKASITLLRLLLDAVERFGLPRALRTDNEAVCVSRWFRFGLWWLGIRHQRTAPGCPWQNGKVERFFGTLKERLNHWQVAGREELQRALGLSAFWYNEVRPHRHLAGLTPMEAWYGIDPFAPSNAPKEAVFFCEWDGLLTGFYLRR